MNTSRVVLLAMFFTIVSASAVRAQMDQEQVSGSRTQELVDLLKDVIRGAEHDRRSSFSITRQLKDLVRRYDWPWRVSLLYDDFRDGDYTYNPRWTVNRGEFWVRRGGGLGTYLELPSSGRYRTSDRGSDSPALDVLTDILLGNREQTAGEAQTGAKPEAEIITRVGISNAFALKLKIDSKNYGDRTNRLEFGPYQGQDRSSGYRLAYESGSAPSLSLLRFGSNRSSVIERVGQEIVLDDGVPHTFEWRRSGDGEMVVLLDAKEVIRTVDRAYSDPFDGFAFINKGGEFEVQQISIFGTQQ